RSVLPSSASPRFDVPAAAVRWPTDATRGKLLAVERSDWPWSVAWQLWKLPRSGGGDRQSGQRRQRRHARLAHDRGTMVLDGPLADVEIGRDVLARVAGQDSIHDLALPWREARQLTSRRFVPGPELGRIPRLLERARNAGQQLVVADRLFDEIRRARLHRRDGYVHVALAGDHDRRQPMAGAVELPQQIHPAHARQVRIDQQTCPRRRAFGGQERLAAAIGQHLVTVRLEHGADRLTHTAVVIDDVDGRASRLRGTVARRCRA